MAEKKAKKYVPVESLKHKDKRTNIPTEELRDFVKEDEVRPYAVLYPRDPSLDPQLVWKGKDAQDTNPLAVPAVPVYIQEKIHPHAIIEDLCAEARRKDEEYAPLLFSDFNGISFEQQIDFYHHEQNWSNRLILGDSLIALTSLAEKEGLKGKVQMIYIDPPYGIKFGSNWQVSTRKRDIKDGKAEDTVRQPEQVRAFRDTWQLGVHSYLGYLRDRLLVARELLSDSGSIFVQIGDENVHLVRCLMDEVFGSENFVSLISFRTKIPLNPIHIANIADYIVWYSKDKRAIKFRRQFVNRNPESDSYYSRMRMPDGTDKDVTLVALMASGYTESCHFELMFQGRRAYPTARNSWKTTPEGMRRLIRADRLRWMQTVPRFVGFAEDYPVMEITNQWTDTQGASGKTFVVQTSTKVIERCLLMTTDPGDLVIDPTCGSGTTAYVAELWGRRWITVDTSRVAVTLARTRLMAARFPYFILADQSNNKIDVAGSPTSRFELAADIKKGFVYKRAIHVTIGSIANNEQIDEIYSKWQPRLDDARNRLNLLLKKHWEQWEVPCEPAIAWSKEKEVAHQRFWRLYRERQAEIGDSITKAADQEVLYNNPYEDNKRVRVSGPFTVESLSPHRILSTDELLPKAQKPESFGMMSGKFEAMILDNLRASGVKTTKRGEGIKFIRLDPYPGVWIHGLGEFADKDGVTKRAAVSIGPEHGTVSPQLIKEAAKEAVQGLGFDVLVICGFAFDPHVAEESARYGKLNVMIAHMNPDLAMGDELLKKTGSGNLFMVFGEPDIIVKTMRDGEIAVEIKGVDVYDPTTGQVRSNSTEDIACWFIDTDYNGESFFVRHAYFCGGDEPYEKLKRALRADIDEAAWNALYSTVSRPFKRPGTGKLAIKVINHYGDEVLKVFSVA